MSGLEEIEMVKMLLSGGMYITMVPDKNGQLLTLVKNKRRIRNHLRDLISNMDSGGIDHSRLLLVCLQEDLLLQMVEMFSLRIELEEEMINSKSGSSMERLRQLDLNNIEISHLIFKMLEEKEEEPISKFGLQIMDGGRNSC